MVSGLCFNHSIFWFLVFWSPLLRDYLFGFVHLAHLALQNVDKDYVTFSYFCNFVTKSDQKPKTKNGMNKYLRQKYQNH